MLSIAGLNDIIVMIGTNDFGSAATVLSIGPSAEEVINGIVDFEQCLQDPANPDYLLPEYNSGDNLHPSAQFGA